MNEESREKTLFEKIIDREIPATILYEDENTISFLDISPFEKGHLLIVPKKPYEFVWEMPEDEFLTLQEVVLKMSKHVKESLNCGLNIHQNNGVIASQVVPHVHFHLVPRIEDKPVYAPGKTDYDSEEEKQKYADMLKLPH